MKIPKITIEQLLEAGVHLGHKTLRWNPKMKKYIFGKRDSIHIIDLTQTLELTNTALEKVHQTISCLLYTSPSPRDRTRSRMPSSA